MRPSVVVVLAVVSAALGAQTSTPLSENSGTSFQNTNEGDAAQLFDCDEFDVMTNLLDAPLDDGPSDDFDWISEYGPIVAANDFDIIDITNNSWIMQFMQVYKDISLPSSSVDCDSVPLWQPDIGMRQSATNLALMLDFHPFEMTSVSPFVPLSAAINANSASSSSSLLSKPDDIIDPNGSTMDSTVREVSQAPAEPDLTRNPPSLVTLSQNRVPSRKRPRSSALPSEDASIVRRPTATKLLRRRQDVNLPYEYEQVIEFANQLMEWQAPVCCPDIISDFGLASYSPDYILLSPSIRDPLYHPIKAVVETFLLNVDEEWTPISNTDKDGAVVSPRRMAQRISRVRRSIGSAITCFQQHCGCDFNLFRQRHPFKKFPWGRFAQFYCSARRDCDWEKCTVARVRHLEYKRAVKAATKLEAATKLD